ncbi:energy transducer TonB [Sphingobium sp. sgz301303]
MKPLALIAITLAASQGALANVSKAARATPTGNPGYWITPEDYPAVDLRNDAEGVTGVKLEVDIEGRVSNCIVTQGSGSETLDAASCTLLQQRARFTPGLDRLGQPIADSYTTRIKWQIPAQEPQPLKNFPKRLQLRVDVDETGAATACTVVSNEGNSMDMGPMGGIVDPCAAVMRSKKHTPFLDANGEPVAVRVESLMEMRVTPIGAAKAQ